MNRNGKESRSAAWGLAILAGFVFVSPLQCANEITIDSHRIEAGAKSVYYFHEGSIVNMFKPGLERYDQGIEVRQTPSTYVTLVKSGRPGAPTQWENTLPGRFIEKLGDDASPHVWLLLDDTEGGSKTHQVFSLNAASGGVEWRREYRITADYLKLLDGSNDCLYLGMGPYVEELDPATGATRRRFYVADPPQTLQRDGDALRIQTTAGGDIRLPLRKPLAPVPPSPVPALAGALLSSAVNCVPGLPAGPLLNSIERRSKAMTIAQRDPACIPVLEQKSLQDPGNPYLHFLLGLARKGQGFAAEAQGDFDRAASVPDLPFFEYAALGNLFELSYLPDHADRCYAITLKAFRTQIPLSPIEYCPEGLHRIFFPADVDAGRMHIDQGNIVRYMELRNIRRRMFLHSDGDYKTALRAMNLQDDPRLKSVVAGEAAYLASLKRDPFLKENHLLGLDMGFLLVEVLQWIAILLIAYAMLGFIFIPFVVSFLILTRWLPPNAIMVRLSQGYPGFLILAIKLAFFPVAFFEFAIESATNLKSSFRWDLKHVLLWIGLAAVLAFAFAYNHFTDYVFLKALAPACILGAMAVIIFRPLGRILTKTSLLSEIRGIVTSTTAKREWLVPGACFAGLYLLASCIVSYFPLSNYAFQPAPGMTFLYAHPQIARQIEERTAGARGAGNRATLLFLKASGLHMRGEIARADELYRSLPDSPWVRNNRAAVLFQQGRREEALKAWRDLAGRNIPAARANLEQARQFGMPASDASWIPLLANPPAEVLFPALIRRSWWGIWDSDPAVQKALKGRS